MREIRLAVAGVGNCASALLQGIEYYRTNDPAERAGVLHPEIGGYRLEDIRPVAAFDVGSTNLDRGRDRESRASVPDATDSDCCQKPAGASPLIG